MSDFVILTDSSADLGADMVQQLDVQVLPLSFSMGQQIYHNYPDNREIDPHAFYQLLRQAMVGVHALRLNDLSCNGDNHVLFLLL